MSQANHSRNYYLSNEKMSDINESIDEYSMNFEHDSGAHGNSRSQISEMISGSHQVTQSRIPRNKAPQRDPIPEEAPLQDINDQHANNDGRGASAKKAVYLGEHVFNTIRERYYETNKITTDDPEVLYDFFLAQRKTLSSMKPINEKDVLAQMPSMQRKLLVKQQFQRILTYYPHDVYYSLCFEVEKLKKDRELQHKVQMMNKATQKQVKKAGKKDIDKIVEKLYKTKGTFQKTTTDRQLTPEQQEKQKRTIFGRNLSEHFQNTYRERGAPTNIQTAQKLHTFWEDLYEREEFGIEWDEATAKESIRKYMCEQIEDLMNYSNRKLGFKCGKAYSLFKFYSKNFEKVQNIYITLGSFQEYVKEYNESERLKMESQEKKAIKEEQKHVQRQKKGEVKKFGRPVSATPLTILSKPKTQGNHLNGLLEKYPRDKVIQALVAEENLHKPRYPMQYGVHDIQNQVKIKQWIRIDPKKPEQKYDQKISHQLFKVFTNTNFHKASEHDHLMELLAEEGLHREDIWKEMSSLLHEAMLVKGYEHTWFIDCIQRYVERTTGANLKLQTNNVLMKKLFHHLNQLDASQRQRELQNLQTLILTSQSIAEKTEKIKSMGEDKLSRRQIAKERSLLNVKLQEKAVEYVKMRLQKNDDKFMLREYLNNLFAEAMKEHKQYVTRQFRVVEGDKECPKLLKYEFFRLVKEINPILLERDLTKKSPVWVPTQGCPQASSFKTFNSFSNYYHKDKAGILSQPERDRYKTGLWGRGKRDDRELLMMTYGDSRECTFQPKISRQNN